MEFLLRRSGGKGGEQICGRFRADPVLSLHIVVNRGLSARSLPQDEQPESVKHAELRKTVLPFEHPLG